VQRTVLLATQLNRSKRFAACATPSHSSGLAFAMAKATQFQQGRRVAPTTKTSSGSSNASAFAAHCCRRYKYSVRGT
jgi:hypothetical protein